MTEPVDLGKRLEELADAMLKDACREATPLPQKMQVFKDISQYHVNLEKIRGRKGGTDTPPAGGMTMGAMRDQVAGAARASAVADDDDQGDDEDEQA